MGTIKKEINEKHIVFYITFIIILILILIVIIIANLTKNITNFSIFDRTNNLKFEDCLKKQDITLYIYSEKPQEVLKKIKINEILNNFKVINCLRNNNLCKEKGISIFPTWMINNKKIIKDITYKDLVSYTSCKEI